MEDETQSVRRILFFSPFYPDELLYSACARYSDRAGFKSKDAAMRDLFGTFSARAIIDLPCRIDHFIAALPLGHSYDAAQIINKHTLFPFYSPFLIDQKRFNRLWKDMQGNNGAAMTQRAGIIAKVIQSPDWLRFCPCCVEEDRKELDETYWHRIHQLPGIQVCPLHKVFLENSNVRTRHRKRAAEFVSAESVLIDIPSPRFLDDSNLTHTGFLRIARNMLWLLSQDSLEPAPDTLHSRYHYLLAQMELASYTGRVNLPELRQAFREYHSQELLATLQCEVDDRKNNWLGRLLQSQSLTRSSHPIYHLLLIDFLGYSVEKFFKLPEKFLPFGSGPWPCLNPICHHYRTQSISKIELKWNHKNKVLPVGIFSCTCGFTYRRTGPDLSSEDQYRIGSVVSRGSLWEAELRKLWTDLDVPLIQIVKRLGATDKYIKSYAVQLKLPFPRRTTQIALSGYSTASSTQQPRLNDHEKLDLYRQEWLAARAAYPDADRAFMKTKFSRLHTWLRRNDKEWFAANLPDKPSRKVSVNGGRVDWGTRDVKLSAQVKDAVERIKDSPGRPVKISMSAINRELNLRRELVDLLEKLPLTSAEVEGALESPEDFAIRRIWWFFKCCCRDNITLTRPKLIAKLSISSKVLESAEVQKALDEVMELFRLQKEA